MMVGGGYGEGLEIMRDFVGQGLGSLAEHQL